MSASKLLAMVVVALSLSMMSRASAKEDWAQEYYGDLKQGPTQQYEHLLREPSPPDGASRLERCIFFQRRGLANYATGNYSAAVRDLLAAKDLSSDSRNDDRCERWRIISDTNRTYGASGDSIGQIDFLRRSIGEIGKDRLRQHFHLHIKLISAYLRLHRIDEAREELSTVRQLLLQLQNSRNWARWKDDVMASIHEQEAHLSVADGKYDAGEQFALQSQEEVSRFFSAIGGAPNAPPSALSPEARAAMSRKIDAQRMVASILAQNGKLGEATIRARAALTDTMYLYSSSSREAATSLALVGDIRLRQGRIERANSLFRQAALTLEGTDVRRSSLELAKVRAQYAMTLAIQSKWSEAATEFERRDADLRLDAGQFAYRGSRHLEWALALTKTGASERSERMLSRMLDQRLKRNYGNPLELAYVHGYLAVALLDRGAEDMAASHFAMAVPELLKVMSSGASLEEEGAYVSQFRAGVVLEAYLDLLYRWDQMGKRLEGRDASDEAFAIADVARNSSVQRAIALSVARAKLPSDTLASLARQTQDADNRIRSLSKALEDAGNELAGQVSDSTIQTLERALQEARSQRIALGKELGRAFPEFERLTVPPLVYSSDVQKVLRPGEGVVSLFATTHALYIWTVTSSQRRFRKVALDKTDLTAQVARLRRSVDLRGGKIQRFDVDDARSVYSLTLAPDRDAWETVKVLTILPSAPLDQLPFGMLLMASDMPAGGAASYATMPWLIKKVAIVQSSSANALVTLRTAPASGAVRLPFIGFGSPLFNTITDGVGLAMRGPNSITEINANDLQRGTDFGPTTGPAVAMSKEEPAKGDTSLEAEPMHDLRSGSAEPAPLRFSSALRRCPIRVSNYFR